MMGVAKLQTRINEAGYNAGGADGVVGKNTYSGLFQFVAKRKDDRPLFDRFGAAAVALFPEFGLTNGLRISGFLGQACHETGGFKWLREIWGPTDAQRRYEGRKDLGNVVAGDGSRYRGRGIFQLTGRANYARYGAKIGKDLVGQPELAETPETSLLIALHYWRDHGCNELADDGDWVAITKKINGGTNGLQDRLNYTTRALGLWS